MALQADILDNYLQMREGNLLREEADMALIKRLHEELKNERSARLKAEKRAAELEKENELLRSVQPVTNNYNIQHDYIEKQVVGL